MADGDMGPLPKNESLDLIKRLLNDATDDLRSLLSFGGDMDEEDEAAIQEQNMHIDRIHRLKKTIERYVP